MKRLNLTGLIASVTIAAATIVLPASAVTTTNGQPAQAPKVQEEVAYSIGCRDINGFGAWGEGYAWNSFAACNIAVTNCRIQATVGTWCWSTGWWWL